MKTFRQLAVLTALCVAASANATHAQTQRNDFEDNTILPFAVEAHNGNTAEIISATSSVPARAGRKLERMIWKQANYQGDRATKSTETKTTGPRIKKEGWYGLSLFLPTGGFPTNKNTIIAQMHAYTPEVDPAKTLTIAVSESGSLGLTYYHWLPENGSPREHKSSGNITLATSVPRGRWLDFVIHVVYSKSGGGLVEVWYDGANTPIRRTNINFGSDAWNGDELVNGTYQKWGLYSYDADNYTAGETRTIYADNVAYIVGNPSDAFKLVNPASRLRYEGEELSEWAISSGDTVSNFTQTDIGLSNDAATNFNASATNDFVTYRVNVPQARTYRIFVGVKKYTNRGVYQLATSGTLSGPYTNRGATQDNYNTVASVNRLDLGIATFDTTGDKAFRFQVTGKNGSSQGYTLGLDYIELVPS